MNNQQQTSAPNQIIPRTRFRELTGMSRTTQWRMEKAGQLPSLVVVDGRVLGYLASAYDAWLKAHSSD